MAVAIFWVIAIPAIAIAVGVGIYKGVRRGDIPPHAAAILLGLCGGMLTFLMLDDIAKWINPQ